jgi:N-methylhydantoinase A/oxoprolinase/acetone carboxylase beta subunit
MADTAAVESVEYRDIVLDDPDNPVRCAVHDRERLHVGQVIEGPAAITEYASTTIIFAGDRLEVARNGELMIKINT